MPHSWKPIEDLPEHWETLRNQEIHSLFDVWKEQSQKPANSNALKEFNERMKRKWAIETGIIEKLYDIDRGITEILILRGIDASLIPHGTTDRPAEAIVPILNDQQEALETLFDFVKQNRKLSTSYIKEIHQLLTRHQESSTGRDQFGTPIEVPIIKGDWKKWPNNPHRSNGTFHEYCPPEHVASEMDNLIKTHLQHVEDAAPAEVEAAWLHHRFTQIHPFQDGNGRVARCLASLIFIQHGWFPLVVSREQRIAYIEALEKADDGDLKPLIRLFADIQKMAFISAISLSEDILTTSEELTIRRIVESAANKIRAGLREDTDYMNRVLDYAEKIRQITYVRFERIQRVVDAELRNIDPAFICSVEAGISENNFYFKEQIIRTARILDYYANTNKYREWIRLKILERHQTNIIASIHCIGRDFNGIMAVSAFSYQREKNDDGLISQVNFNTVCRELFQFNYREEWESIEQRYQDWMDETMIIALACWRKYL
jgi:Fic family protein